MKKVLSLVLLAGFFVSVGCKPKANCGTKRQHKAQHSRMKSFAPGYVN